MDARTTIVEATTCAAKHVELWWEAEHYRVTGEVMMMQAADGDPGAESETWVQRAVDTARRQGAKALELRAAITLARLRRMQGRSDEGREVLRGTYAWFTEGFETADLRSAAELMG